jgi:predicted DNA-binding antitoxin AbrB/MazE fold protein
MHRGQDIPFVYEHGVLKPEGHVDLPEGARGIARIIEDTSGVTRARIDSHQHALDVIRRIGESGDFNSGGRKLTRDEMHERG